MKEIEAFRRDVDNGSNPRDIKFLLAEEIIERFHSKEDAIKARENFISRFQKGALPEDIEDKVLEVGDKGIPLANALREAGLTSSTSESRRMIKQGAVKVDGERVSDESLLLAVGTKQVVQVGKRRIARIQID